MVYLVYSVDKWTGDKELIGVSKTNGGVVKICNKHVEKNNTQPLSNEDIKNLGSIKQTQCRETNYMWLPTKFGELI